MKKVVSLLLVLVMCLSLCACGAEKASSPVAIQPEGTNTEGNNVDFETPLLAWEDNKVKLEIIGFFQEKNIWAESPTLESGITFKLTNKTDAELNAMFVDAYIGTDNVSIIIKDVNSTVAPGKSVTQKYLINKYVGSNVAALDSIEELYELDGKFSIYFTEDYSANYDLTFSIPELRNGGGPAARQAELEQMMEKYGDVVALLQQDTWYFNGGSDTILNGIRFSSNKATITQVYFDGNGKHENGSNDCDYVLDGENITVTLTDGSEMVIPYVVNGDAVTLGNQEYFTPAEVDAALQGYWGVSYESMGNGHQYYIYFNHGTVTSENAAESAMDNDGSYFYYGPYEGTYTLNFGGIDTEMRHGKEWFFNIIDGAVAVLHYDHVCSPATGFPGENGYSF